MNTDHFKKKLLDEKNILIEEILDLGTLKISKDDYSAEVEPGNETTENIELADMFEVESNKDAVLDQLEDRLIDVERALSKIDDNTYGICEISGQQIEEARLEANPAARTNIENREGLL